MAEPSLGAGIGLGYKMPSSAGIVDQLRQARQEESAAMADIRKQRAKERKEESEYAATSANISVEGVIPYYTTSAQTEAGKVLDYVKKHQGQNLKGDMEFQKILIDSKAKIKGYQDLSKRFYDQSSKADGKNFKLNERLSKAALSSPDDVVDETTQETARDVWDKATQGTGVYTHGVLEIIEDQDYLEDMQKNVVGSGLKYKSIVDPKTGDRMGLQAPSKTAIDNTWSLAKQQKWYQKGFNKNIALGFSPEEAEAQLKQGFITSIPRDVSAHNMQDKGGGGLELDFSGGRGQVGDLIFDWARQPSKAKKDGETVSVEVGGDILIAKQEGKRVPPISLKRGDVVHTGIPRKLTQNGTWIQMFVAKDKTAGSEKFWEMVDISPPETNPDKYDIIEVPLTSDENKKVFRQVLGGNEYYPRDLWKKLKQSQSGAGAYTENQSAALAAFKAQVKREPTAAELDKLLKKYK